MAKKVTKKQLNEYIGKLVSWKNTEFKTYLQQLREQSKSMTNESSSNPPGPVPPPPKH